MGAHSSLSVSLSSHPNSFTPTHTPTHTHTQKLSKSHFSSTYSRGMSVDEKKNIRLSSLCESLTDVPVCVCVCSHKAEEANVCIAGKKIKGGSGSACVCVCEDTETMTRLGFPVVFGRGWRVILGARSGDVELFSWTPKNVGRIESKLPLLLCSTQQEIYQMSWVLITRNIQLSLGEGAAWGCMQKEVHMVSHFICTPPYPCSWTDFVLESWQGKDWLMYAKHFHSFMQGNV